MAHRDADGDPLAHVEAGVRLPAILLVHGSLGDYRSFQPLMAPLSAHRRTIAVSLRHCWPAQWDGRGGRFTVEGHAADLAAFVDARGLGPVHVVGHSRGGAVSLQLALAHPRSVRSLVLADPGGLEALLPDTPEGREMAAETQSMFARLRDRLARGDAVAAARGFVEDLNGPGAWERRTPEQRQMLLDNIRTGPACAQRPSFTPADIASIAVPILPITGAHSPSRYAAAFDAMRAINPRVAPTVTIEGAAHAMHRERPAAFGDAVVAFVGPH